MDATLSETTEPAFRRLGGLRFSKGHGTGNDFVLIADPEGLHTIGAEQAAALCDRHRGIGGDGLIRAVPSRFLPEGRSLLGEDPEAEWFMDYRNADGSVAEMCGNGIRLYARYLVDAGLAEPGRLAVATRDGIRQVSLGPTGDVTVEMGLAKMLGTATAVIGGQPYDGTRVDMGNPHLVCLVDGPLDGYDLTAPPAVDPDAFPEGGNVELVSVRGDRHLAMRVHERGVGETRSCGTGACAAAAAMAQATAAADGEWTVDVPGGRLVVTLDADQVRLAGPAVMVAGGVLDEAWLSAVTGN